VPGAMVPMLTLAEPEAMRKLCSWAQASVGHLLRAPGCGVSTAELLPLELRWAVPRLGALLSCLKAEPSAMRELSGLPTFAPLEYSAEGTSLLWGCCEEVLYCLT
jgi:hypothetical protein